MRGLRAHDHGARGGKLKLAVAVIGRRPWEYDCDTCPAAVRISRRCDRRHSDPREDMQARIARAARGEAPLKGSDPNACPTLRIEETPRVRRWLSQYPVWRSHAIGPHGQGRLAQPVSFLGAMDIIAAKESEMERLRREQEEAEHRARALKDKLKR